MSLNHNIILISNGYPLHITDITIKSILTNPTQLTNVSTTIQPPYCPITVKTF